MATPFSISRSRFAGLTPEDLQKEIQAHTGNETETDSIIRSMDRFGEDDSIRSFEITPKPRRQSMRLGPDSTWTVRAVR